MRAASAGPSKLRIGSTTNDIVAPIDSVSLGPTLNAAFSAASIDSTAAAPTPPRAGSLADPDHSAGGANDEVSAGSAGAQSLVGILHSNALAVVFHHPLRRRQCCLSATILMHNVMYVQCL